MLMEEPKVISLIIIILIIASAVFAFSGFHSDEQPCDSYRNIQQSHVPARCINYFESLKP